MVIRDEFIENGKGINKRNTFSEKDDQTEEAQIYENCGNLFIHKRERRKHRRKGIGSSTKK